MDRHLWLVGMMGAGKSATAGVLAARWHVTERDTDAEVAARAGCSIAELWGERGERAFRDMEAAAVARIAFGEPTVVATGGGVVLSSANNEVMRATGRIVWLSAEPAVLQGRVGGGEGRPLLAAGSGAERIAEILDQRSARYAALADLTVDTSALTVGATADRIEAWWNEF